MGERPWAFVQTGHLKHPEFRSVPSTAPGVTKSIVPVHKAAPVVPVMDLPVWNGPWPMAWKFACSYQWNAGKWLSGWRPILFDDYIWDPWTGMTQTAPERVRFRCPK